MHIVTISATYGAGGAFVGPAVAERLGVPFVDRAIPVAVANDLGIPVDDALSRDERVKGWLSRMLAATAPLSVEYMVEPDHDRSVLLSDAEVLRCTEGAIRKAVCTDGGVILGRAAAIVLADHPGALHVRLDGDPQRRVAQAMALLGVGEREAWEALRRNDKARLAYVRHYYGADAASPQHYHLVLDSTRVPLEGCTEIIVAAARACGGGRPDA
jgi:cytidylate kinase